MQQDVQVAQWEESRLMGRQSSWLFISPFVITYLASMDSELHSHASALGQAATSKLNGWGVAQGHKRRQMCPGGSKAIAQRQVLSGHFVPRGCL